MKELMPFFVLLVRFGSSLNFTSCYIIQIDLFPTLFLGASFGICNVFARTVSIGAPLAAEIPEPYPIVIFCVISGIALLVSFLIIEEKPEIKSSAIETKKNEQ